MKALEVTSIEAIKAQAGERVVRLPGFAPDETFCARLRRLSLLELAETGSIPNALMGAVGELYDKGLQGKVSLADTAKAYRLIAEKSLVEPTAGALREAGVTLTDAQLLAIYVYSVGGVETMRSFRQEPSVLQPVPERKSVRRAPQHDDEHP